MIQLIEAEVQDIIERLLLLIHVGWVDPKSGALKPNCGLDLHDQLA